MSEKEDTFPLQASNSAEQTAVVEGAKDRDAASEEFCFSPSGAAVSLAGDLNIQPKSQFVGEPFERTNGDRCPCSFVS